MGLPLGRRVEPRLVLAVATMWLVTLRDPGATARAGIQPCDQSPLVVTAGRVWSSTGTLLVPGFVDAHLHFTIPGDLPAGDGPRSQWRDAASGNHASRPPPSGGYGSVDPVSALPWALTIAQAWLSTDAKGKRWIVSGRPARRRDRLCRPGAGLIVRA